MGLLFKRNWKKVTGVRATEPLESDEILRVIDGLGPGGITELQTTLNNNEASPVSIQGFAFDNAEVRAFEALVSVAIDATGNLYELFTLRGIQDDATWTLDSDAIGDTSGIVFSITAAGQVQYTSTNVSGFVSNTCRIRAITLSL
jgi:hypothetical protein